MTIRRRFLITVWLAALLLAAGAAGTAAAISKSHAVLRDYLRFQQVAADLSSLRDLTFNFQIAPSPRVEAQWRIKHTHIDRALASTPGIPPEITQAVGDLRTFFEEATRPSPASQAPQARSLDGRLRSQLFSSLNTEERRIRDWLQDYADSSRSRLLAITEAYTAGAVALLALLAALTGWILLTTGTRIVAAASTLKEGAEAVARGDLGHRIEIAGADEFAALASAFNAMTRELAQKAELESRLAQAQKLEAIGTLAGGIAHDFNNLLQGITGFTEMSLLRLPPDAPVRHDLEEVLRIADRAAELVRQILTFSRMNPQEEKPVQVKAIVGEALKLLRASIPSTIEFRSRLASDALVLADPGDIHRIVVNLCTNAYLAMRERGGVLEVDLREVELDERFAALHPAMRPGAFLRLAVRDTGHGMSPEVKARIFDPFFTTRGGEGGTGMGLSVVHGIISKRGGAITVESEQGKGSSFEVFLPALAKRAEPGEKTVPEMALPGSERILVVDDDPQASDLLAKELALLGYQTRSFTSSPAALAAFVAAPDAFDLVITDITMPEMTGDTLMFRMRALRPGLAVVLCTGHSEQMSPEKAKGLGASALVMKPFSLAALSRVIRRAIEGG